MSRRGPTSAMCLLLGLARSPALCKEQTMPEITGTMHFAFVDWAAEFAIFWKANLKGEETHKQGEAVLPAV
jgi:hypothetical protein